MILFIKSFFTFKKKLDLPKDGQFRKWVKMHFLNKSALFDLATSARPSTKDQRIIAEKYASFDCLSLAKQSSKMWKMRLSDGKNVIHVTFPIDPMDYTTQINIWCKVTSLCLKV